MDASSHEMLQVAALSKRYGEEAALADVAFSVRAGEVLGLIGPNGAGKTTLLEALAGLVPVDSGEVFWRGEPLVPARRNRSIFYLPDGIRPWSDQYVVRVIAFAAAAYRRPRASIAEATARVGLDPVLGKRVRALSKGYARRLMWALALIVPHPLLLMDEPFDGFDLKQTREMMRVVRQLAEAGRTLVLSTHQLIDAERVCDRFVLLAGGRIRGEGTLDALRARTQRAAAGLEEVFLALA